MRFIPCQLTLMLMLLVPPALRGQVSAHLPPKALLQIQVPRPSVDVSSPVTATATFDPPVARVGEPVFYRVSMDAAEASIQWPGTVSSPPELEFGSEARGQLTQDLMHKFRPLTSFLYKVRAVATGRFTVPDFVVKVRGRPVTVPAASLDVNNAVSGLPARQLVLDVSATNAFIGQPLRARVLLPASPSNTVEALRDVQLNGDGFMSDRSTMRQAVKMTEYAGWTGPAYIYEITLIPIMTGTLRLSAQAFTAGREFTAPITIGARVVIPGGAPQYVFLVSDPVEVKVRPLPTAGGLPGFTGSIGNFRPDQPQLSTNRLRVNQPVHLTVAVHSSGDLNHLVPPTPPLVKNWVIIPDKPSGASGFSYTLIPLTDRVHETPVIPFSAFDPTIASYVNLSISSLPVTVTEKGLPTELPAMGVGIASSRPSKLSSLSPTPGEMAAGLKPSQLNGWLVCFQIVPVLAILGLWQWDRRRRFLEVHPDIVRRREARRVLRREKRRLRDAEKHSDPSACVRHATNAMKIACAPHYPAHPQALVCAEVLVRLSDADRSGAAGETVRKLFAATDAQFAATPRVQLDWPALRSKVYTTLQKLEEQL